MLFGFIVVRVLVLLVRPFDRLPNAVSRTFARVFNHRRMGAKLDRAIDALGRRLTSETEADLVRGMHYPVRWDPFFTDFMTLEDVYHFPTRHFDFHARQLTLEDPDQGALVWPRLSRGERGGHLIRRRCRLSR